MKSITFLPEFYPDGPVSPPSSGDSRLRYYAYNSDKAQLKTLYGQFRQLTKVTENTISSIKSKQKAQDNSQSHREPICGE